MESGFRRTMSNISEGAASVASSALSATTETLEDLEAAHMVTMIIFGLCVFIVIVAFGWLWSKLTLESRNCQSMNALYKSTPPGFSSIDPDSPENCNSLRDFYVRPHIIAAQPAHTGTTSLASVLSRTAFDKAFGASTSKFTPLIILPSSLCPQLTTSTSKGPTIASHSLTR